MLNKNENQKGIFSGRRFLLLGVFVSAFFLLNIFVVEDASATECRCATRAGFRDYTPTGTYEVVSRQVCQDTCIQNGATHYSYGLMPTWSDAKGTTNAVKGAFKDIKNVGSKITGLAVSTLAAPFLWVFNFMLLAVWMVGSLFLFLAGMILDWAVNPANFKLVVGNQAVYEGWKIVRDMLNMSFILVLLYSAFCTIFQIEKYHIKKIILMIVLMALLVNFSFPIARFIIDSANVLMYFILNKAFPNLSNTSGVSANIVTWFELARQTAPDFQTSDLLYAQDFTVKVLFAIIFIFLLAITLMIIAALMVIRIVVLAILIIFSPVGFVAAIFPSTKGFADSWWTQLFKQSFFGPVMAFMIYLAITMMQTMNKDEVLMNSIKTQIGQQGDLSNYSSIIVTGTYLAIPVVILWVGLISAQKIGAMGASAVMSYGKKFGMMGLKSRLSRRVGGYMIKKGGGAASWALNKTVGNKHLGPLGRAGQRITGATYGRMADYGEEMEYQAMKEKREAGDKKARRFERGVSDYKDKIKNDTSTNLHTELDQLLKKDPGRRNEMEKQAFVAIIEKLREDDSLDTSKLGNLGGRDIVEQVEHSAGGKDSGLGKVYAEKLLKSMPHLAESSTRALEIANKELEDKAKQAGTTHVPITQSQAIGHYISKIKGATGAKGLSGSSLQEIVKAGHGDQLADNLDSSVLLDLARNNRAPEILAIKTAVQGRTGSTNIAQVLTNLKSSTNTKHNDLAIAIEADPKLNRLMT